MSIEYIEDHIRIHKYFSTWATANDDISGIIDDGFEISLVQTVRGMNITFLNTDKIIKKIPDDCIRMFDAIYQDFILKYLNASGIIHEINRKFCSVVIEDEQAVMIKMMVEESLTEYVYGEYGIRDIKSCIKAWFGVTPDVFRFRQNIRRDIKHELVDRSCRPKGIIINGLSEWRDQ